MAGLAARAELIRLRLKLRRVAKRLLFALAATLFLLAAVAGLHIAAVLWLARDRPVISALFIVAGADAVVAALFAAFAARDKPGAAEREALRLRRQATDGTLFATLLAALRAGRGVGKRR